MNKQSKVNLAKGRVLFYYNAVISQLHVLDTQMQNLCAEEQRTFLPMLEQVQQTKNMFMTEENNLRTAMGVVSKGEGKEISYNKFYKKCAGIK